MSSSVGVDHALFFPQTIAVTHINFFRLLQILLMSRIFLIIPLTLRNKILPFPFSVITVLLQPIQYFFFHSQICFLLQRSITSEVTYSVGTYIVHLLQSKCLQFFRVVIRRLEREIIHMFALAEAWARCRHKHRDYEEEEERHQPPKQLLRIDFFRLCERVLPMPLLSLHSLASSWDFLAKEEMVK